MLLDQPAFAPRRAEAADADAARTAEPRAVRHALAEFEMPVSVVGPDQDLAEALAR